MTVSGTDLSMVRGDSEILNIMCSEAPFEEGDSIKLTVRQSVDSDIVIQKTVTDFDDGMAVIEFDPGDTSGLDFGDYVYDIQLTRADGKVTTIIKVSQFRIEEEVTY